MRWLVCAATFVSVVLVSSSASADLIDPREDACRGKSESDACKADGGDDGHCAKSTCSKNDYSEGTPPKSVEYDCLLCKPGAPPEATPAPDVKSDSKPVSTSESDKPKNKSGCAVGASPVSMASVAGGPFAARRCSAPSELVRE